MEYNYNAQYDYNTQCNTRTIHNEMQLQYTMTYKNNTYYYTISYDCNTMDNELQ